MIRMRIRDAELQMLLKQMSKASTNGKPFFKYAYGVIHRSVIQNFRKQGHAGDIFTQDFTNEFLPWEPLSDYTKMMKGRRGGKASILMDSNRLRGSMGTVLEITSTRMEYGTNVEYAAMHHFGTKGLSGGVLKAKGGKHLTLPLPGYKGKKVGDLGRSFTRGNVIYEKFVVGPPVPAFLLKDEVTIPARPFLTFSERDMDKILNFGANYILGVVKGFD